jgi:hypothetical protein
MGKKEVELLKQWINPLYLAPQNITKIQQRFRNDGYIQLAELVLQTPKKLSWKRSYIPDMHSYQHAALGQDKKVEEFITSPAFFSLVGTMIGKNVKHVTAEFLLFQHRDYSLIHDSVSHKGIMFWVDFTKEWDNNFGGQTVFFSDSAPLIFTSAFASLYLVALQKHMHMFTKYVNCCAGKKELLLLRGFLE